MIRVVPRKILGRKDVDSRQKEAKKYISGLIKNLIARTKSSLRITVAWRFDEREEKPVSYLIQTFRGDLGYLREGLRLK